MIRLIGLGLAAAVGSTMSHDMAIGVGLLTGLCFWLGWE